MCKVDRAKMYEGTPIIDSVSKVVLIPPCSIGENVVFENCTIGPNIVIEDNCVVKNVHLANSTIKVNSIICGENE